MMVSSQNQRDSAANSQPSTTVKICLNWLSGSALTIVLMIMIMLPVGKVVMAGEPADAQREDFFRRAAGALDANEGPGGYHKICWNDAGAGISVGKLQWNQKRGDLPLYLKQCHQADAKLFAEVFGSHTSQMLDEKFIRRTDNFTATSSLGRAMKKALAQPAFQQVQDSLIRTKLEWSLKVAREYNHASELMVVQIADISNQMGAGGARSALKRAGVKQLSPDKEAIAAFCKQTKNRRANGAKRDEHLAKNFSASAVVP